MPELPPVASATFPVRSNRFSAIYSSSFISEPPSGNRDLQHYSRAEPRLLPVKLLHHPPDRNDLNLFGTANMIAGQPCPSAPDVEAVLTRRNTRCPAESDGESRRSEEHTSELQ